MSAYALAQSVSVTTLPLLQLEYGITQASAAWVLTSFLLAASVATPILGRLGDSYGKRRMLLACLSMLVVGSLLAAAAPTIQVMIAARVMQGLGGAVLPLSFAIVRDELLPERVPAALSLISSLLAVGYGAGIVMAGPLAESVGLHWVFLLPALVAAVATLAVLVRLPESPIRTGARVPVVPGLLLAGWLVALLIGMSRAPVWGWGSPAAVACLTLTAVQFGAWVLVEWRIDVPLIDLRLMARRGVWTANLIGFLAGMAMFGTFSFLPQFSQTPRSTGYGFGASVTEAGYMMLPATVATFVCGLVTARLMRRVGARVVVTAGCALAFASLVALVVFHDDMWQGQRPRRHVRPRYGLGLRMPAEHGRGRGPRHAHGSGDRCERQPPHSRRNDGHRRRDDPRDGRPVAERL